MILISSGEVNMFGFNETYQRALLNWQRAAAQGKISDDAWIA